MYEYHRQPLLSRAAFRRRLLNHGSVVGAVILFSLAVGVACYHVLGNLSWIDSLLNAAMILGGEGPVDRMDSTAAKLFASVYALYSGLVLLVSVGILFAPIMHRILHSLHVEPKHADDD